MGMYYATHPFQQKKTSNNNIFSKRENDSLRFAEKLFFVCSYRTIQREAFLSFLLASKTSVFERETNNRFLRVDSIFTHS